MSATYEPGTVAMVTAYNRPQPYRAHYTGTTWRELGADAFCVDEPTSISPLVVLDLSECPSGQHLPKSWPMWLRDSADQADKVLLGAKTPRGGVLRWLADQIEAQTSPPKPAEPTTWLAAVEDAEGNRWALTGGPTEPGLEWYSPDLNVRRPYAAVNAVRVLSEGVQG